MSTIIGWLLGPIVGAFSDFFLGLIHDYHERQLQSATDQLAASNAQLGHIKAAIEAKRAVDVDIAARGVRAPDPNSRD